MFLRPSDVDAMCDAAGSLNISEAKPKAKASPKAKAKAAACLPMFSVFEVSVV